MSTAASATRSRRNWKIPRWLKWTGWGLAGVALAAVALFYITVQFGAVQGVELNPHSFARRSYSLYEIPLIRVQVRGIRREDLNGDVAEFLAGKGYIVAAKNAPDVWHIISGSRGTRAPRVGDADILSRYLDAADADEKRVWIEWSSKHPELAKVFWPAVGVLAQEELYIHIPALFDQAQRADDPKALQKQVHTEVAARLLELAGQMTAAEQHADALRVLDKAAKLEPDNVLVKRARELARAKAPAASKTAASKTAASKTAAPKTAAPQSATPKSTP
jgi:hypothetical protein